jgi:hypothetical protein
MNHCIATIVSANYLAYARVLGESVARHEPGMTFKVLVVDRATPDIRRAVEDSGLDVTYAEDLGLANFAALAFKYELVELNTALKPTFLKRLFIIGHEAVIYLDPDIRLFSALSPVTRALSESQIVITPHATTPALDGLRPSDIDFLRNGAYNLGFIALRHGSASASMLDWWESRCLSYGFNDLGFGTFVDQKWIDLVPSYFESVHVLRDVTCNVAYWNLHERTVAMVGGSPMVNGKLLSFFHFSGVKSDIPGELSRHQTRHALAAGTPLLKLVSEYCSELIRAGHHSYAKIPYSYARFDNGAEITRLMRRASCVEPNDTDPFLSSGALFRNFRRRGWTSRSQLVTPATTNTLNFDAAHRRVAIVNIVVRLIAQALGPERLEALLKYATFLNRESNCARVLMKAPFEHRHVPSHEA